MNRRKLLTLGAGALGAWSLAGGRPARAATLAERLGHGPETRLLMIHADDIGMCHSVNAASQRALTEGIVSSGSIMVPCPWFPAIAAWSKAHPEACLGLHLTLTSEWQHYRWRPVTPPDRVPGLLDPDGFLWRRVEDVAKHARAEEVEREIRAQIDRALAFGLKPTHVDSHMGTLFSRPDFFEAYVKVAAETRLMPMLPGPTPEILLEARQLGIDYGKMVERLQAGGFVILDRLVTSLTGSTYEARMTEFEKLVRELKPGVTELIVHLAGNDEEIRHVTGNWEPRYNELRLCTDPAARKLLEREGVKRVSYRDLAPLWKPA
ncbi:MAG: polysaccharide deacetylase family protein [Armatimonadota bacterium]